VGESQGDDNAGGAVERVTLTEAATLLGCHRNTVKNRIRAGIYRAEKVHTENGPTWMIERDSLTNKPPTSARQQGVGEVPAIQQEAIQELARAIVRESGIAQDPEQTALLEGNKQAAEVAKTLVIVGSGLLVGMAAVVGFLPAESRTSLLLSVAFLLVILSIFSGFQWMQHIAAATARAEAAQGGAGHYALRAFLVGLLMFIVYVIVYVPLEKPGNPETRRVLEIGAIGAVIATVWLTTWIIPAAVRWFGRRSKG
jgi:hypothetical protein